MITIRGEVDLCACADGMEVHDAYGCTNESCNCEQTHHQVADVGAIRESLLFMKTAG